MTPEIRNHNELIPTRHSLLSRLKNWKDDESWRVFFDTYWRLIYKAALKAGLTDSEAQDVVQETVISVAKNLPRFDSSKASFKTWLSQVTRWRIADQLRKRQAQARNLGMWAHRDRAPSTAHTATVERVADPKSLDSYWEGEWENNLLEIAILRAKRKVDPKQYQMFYFYVLKQWPIARVARALQVNAARVYLAKHRIVKLIKKELTYLKNKPI